MFMLVLWTELYNVLVFAQIVYLIFKTPFHIDLQWTRIKLEFNVVVLFLYILLHVYYDIPVVREINHCAVLYNNHVMPYGHSCCSYGKNDGA